MFLNKLPCKWISNHFTDVVKIDCRNVNIHKGKHGKVMLLSATVPLQKHACIRSLLLHSSHQIKFLLCSALVLYLQNVLLKQHKHVTMRTLWGVLHRVKPDSWSNQILGQIIFCLSWLSMGLSRVCLISLFVFHKCRLFLENRLLRMCKLRSCFCGVSAHQGSLKLSDAW